MARGLPRPQAEALVLQAFAGEAVEFVQRRACANSSWLRWRPGSASASIRSGECGLMPYVNLQITKGATRQQKAEIVKEFTRPWSACSARTRRTPIS